MTMTKAQIQSEAAIWAEGTKFLPSELVGMYDDYRTTETESGCDPLDFQRWAEDVVGIVS